MCIRDRDNGGGYRPDSRNRGTGTGMKVIMQSIQILNNKNKEAIDVSVHNVSLQSGEMWNFVLSLEMRFLDSSRL